MYLCICVSVYLCIWDNFKASDWSKFGDLARHRRRRHLRGLRILSNQRPRNYLTQTHRYIHRYTDTQRIDILSGPALRAAPAKMSRIFHLSAPYLESQMPKWIAFFPNQVKFSRNLGFLRRFLKLVGKISDIQKLRLYLLFYSKRPFWSHGFNEKISLKNGPPCAEIFVKKFKHGTQNQTATPFCFFSNILAQGGPFLKPILHWNHGIETLVLSTIKGPKRVFKTPKKFPTSLKNCLKNKKLRENLTRLGKKAFHLGICDP